MRGDLSPVLLPQALQHSFPSETDFAEALSLSKD